MIFSQLLLKLCKIVLEGIIFELLKHYVFAPFFNYLKQSIRLLKHANSFLLPEDSGEHEKQQYM